MRMTEISKNNVLGADKIMVTESAGFWMVRVEKEGRAAYLNSAVEIMLYPTQAAAVRAIKRLRPDATITSL